MQILWLKNNEPIDFEEEPRFVSSSDDSLTITQTHELDSGTYTCLAKTELDEVSASAQLIVQGNLTPVHLNANNSIYLFLIRCTKSSKYGGCCLS